MEPPGDYPGIHEAEELYARNEDLQIDYGTFSYETRFQPVNVGQVVRELPLLDLSLTTGTTNQVVRE